VTWRWLPGFRRARPSTPLDVYFDVVRESSNRIDGLPRDREPLWTAPGNGLRDAV
jgi:hypothetical protein